MPAPNDPTPPHGEITIFETEDGRTRVEVRFRHDNVWLTQKLMAQLYECSTDRCLEMMAGSPRVHQRLSRQSPIPDTGLSAGRWLLRAPLQARRF